MTRLRCQATFAPGQGLSLLFFDPTGASKVQVTSTDVVRASVHAVAEPGRRAALVGTFTATGRSKFCSLTRTLAERGVRLHHNQRFAFAVGGLIFQRPTVDPRAFPHGMCGSASFQVMGFTLPQAQQLARVIRG